VVCWNEDLIESTRKKDEAHPLFKTEIERRGSVGETFMLRDEATEKKSQREKMESQKRQS